jgi:type I restriction enzyme S subunit
MTYTENLPTLPEKWCWTTVGKISQVASGGTPKTNDETNFGGDIAWITPADLSGYKNMYISKGLRNLSEKGLNSSSAVLLPKGTVIFSSRAPIGYVAIAANEISTNQGCKNFIPYSCVFNEYLYHYLKGNKSLAERYASGTTFLELSAKKASILPIPLPPLPEQHRIVQKIEDFFTDLDAGVQKLEKAKVQIRNYRQAVLKWAIEGKIVSTEAEIAENECRSFESADSLLERILEERGLETKSKISRISTTSLCKNENNNSKGLPVGWCLTTYEQIGDWVGGGTPKTTEEAFWKNGTIPWISPKDMKSSKIYDAQDKITESAVENSAAKIIPAGSLLFVVRSGILRRILPIGLTMVDSAVNQDLKALVPSKLLDPDYLLLSAQGLSEDIRNFCTKSGTTVESIEFSALKSYSFPLPPLAEQHRIVSEIERRFSVIDQIEKTIDQALIQAEKLRQSILKKAFEGKLLPQNSIDESASILLEKVKKEKANLAASNKIKRKSTSKLKTTEMGKMKSSEADIQDTDLYKILNSSNSPLTPKKLWQLSKLDIEDFYERLKVEVEKSRIVERRPNDIDVYLEIHE